MRKILLAFIIASWAWAWHLVGIAQAVELSASGGWLHTSSTKAGDSEVVGLRAEQPIWGGFSLGLDADYHAPMDRANVGDLSGFSLIGEALFYPPLGWKLQPYVFGGAGWSWWDFDRSTEYESKRINVDFGDSLAYKVGLGAYYPITKNVSIGIEGSYFKTDIPKDSYYDDGSYAQILGDDAASGRIRHGNEEKLLVARVKVKF